MVFNRHDGLVAITPQYIAKGAIPMARGRKEGTKIVNRKAIKPAPEAEMQPSIETPHDKFRRLAAKRVDKVLNDLRVISNLGNHFVYQAKAEEIELINKALEAAMIDARTALSRIVVAEPTSEPIARPERPAFRL